MKNNKQNIVPVLRDSYLRAIRNSIGTKLFRNFFALVDGKKKDILQSGDLSCAYFVSCVLKIFGLIKNPHLTVKRTIADMKQSGWRETKNLKVGCVLVWEKQRFNKDDHAHIGFYIGNNQAISNFYKKRTPMKHSFTFGGKAELSQGHAKRGGKRKIEGIWWNKKLDK